MAGVASEVNLYNDKNKRSLIRIAQHIEHTIKKTLQNIMRKEGVGSH